MIDHTRKYAELSKDGLYRYRLTREWGPTDGCKRICWIMLNPSTADGLNDDPTIRKCMGFTARLGFNALEVVNLFAFRATDPKDLVRAHKSFDIRGPLNEAAILAATERSSLVICAWGAGIRALDRDFCAEELVVHATVGHPQVRCLGRCRGDGEPRHPLMLPYSAQLEAWP